MKIIFGFLLVFMTMIQRYIDYNGKTMLLLFRSCNFVCIQPGFRENIGIF